MGKWSREAVSLALLQLLRQPLPSYLPAPFFALSHILLNHIESLFLIIKKPAYAMFVRNICMQGSPECIL